jgi:hypothetical protein
VPERGSLRHATSWVHAGEISALSPTRPRALAAAALVPVPPKGSRTIPSGGAEVMARVALKAAARARGAAQPGGRQPKRRGRLLRDGRDPVGVGAAIGGGPVDARAWDVPTAGGTVLQ